MGSFTIATLAGRLLAELPLDDAARDLVVGDLLERLPPLDSAGMPRLLLGPRELGWSERLADLALASGAVLTLVLVPDPEQAAVDLLGAEGTPVRLAAARALSAMGAAAAGQAEELAGAALSDPDARVGREALSALRCVGAAVGRGSEALRLSEIAQLAYDLEDPLKYQLHLRPFSWVPLIRQLDGLLLRWDASPGQAALRRQTVLRRLAPLDPQAARRHEPLLAHPLKDPRPEVRLAAVAGLGSTLLNRGGEDYHGHYPKLCSLVAGDACPDVRNRAAAIVVLACQKAVAQHLRIGQPLDAGLELARATLAAEMEALQRSALPADRRRMEAIQSLQRLLC